MDSDTPPTPGPVDGAPLHAREQEASPAGEVLYASTPVTVVTGHESGGEVVRLVLAGDVDVHRSHVVREAAAAAVRPQRPLVVDCRDLDFMDSSALALFAVLIRSGQPVTVEALAPHLQSLLSITGLDQLVATRPGRPA